MESNIYEDVFLDLIANAGLRATTPQGVGYPKSAVLKRVESRHGRESGRAHKKGAYCV
jgi:hypothetical protein